MTLQLPHDSSAILMAHHFAKLFSILSSRNVPLVHSTGGFPPNPLRFHPNPAWQAGSPLDLELQEAKLSRQRFFETFFRCAAARFGVVWRESAV